MSRRRARLSAALICAVVSLAAGPGRGPWPAVPGCRGVEVVERHQRGGEVVAQRVPQPLGVPGPFPDQRLVRPGHHLDRRGLRAVPGHRPQLVGVGAHHVRQHVRVAGVALGTRHPVPFPVPGRLQRVDRKHRVPGRDQRRHPRAPVGLDPDQHLPAVLSASSPSAHRSSRATGPSPPRPRAAGPWPAAGPRRPSARRRGGPQPSHLPRTASTMLPPRDPDNASSLRENHQRPNESVLTPHQAGTTSHQRSTLPATGRGTVFRQDSKVQEARVLTCRRLPDPSLPHGRPGSPH